MRIQLAGVLLLTAATSVWADAPAFRFVELSSISRDAKFDDGADSEKATAKGYAVNASFTAGTTFYFPVGIESIDRELKTNGNTRDEAREITVSGGVGIRFITTPNSSLFFDYRKLHREYNDQYDDGYDDDDSYSGRSQRAGWRWMPGNTFEFMYMLQRDTIDDTSYTEKTRVVGARIHLSRQWSLGYRQSKLTNDDTWDSAEAKAIDLQFDF